MIIKKMRTSDSDIDINAIVKEALIKFHPGAAEKIKDFERKIQPKDQSSVEELDLENFHILDEKNLEPNDHIIGDDDDSFFENLITKPSFDTKEIIMDNSFLDDIFEVGSRTTIFEEKPRLQLPNSSFGKEIITSSYQMLHDSLPQISSLVPWIIHYEPSHSNPNTIPDSDLLTVSEPLSISIEPVIIYSWPLLLLFLGDG